MKLNQLTYQISLGILVVTALYTLVYSGVTGLLLAAAVSLIAAAFIDQFEVVVAITVIFAVMYTLYFKRFIKGLEPFEDLNNTQHITKRIGDMKKSYHPAQQQLKDTKMEPAGVYDPAVEGFQDLQPQQPKDGASQSSSSAPTKLTADQVNDDDVKAVTSAISEKKKSDKEIEKEEFQSATNELFKLGKMPSENEDGPKLDPGQTLMKAMSSLDPSTITSMTTDTKKLLETQKGLMSMLNQMRPVLADGKELLQTFSGMFGAGNQFKL